MLIEFCPRHGDFCRTTFASLHISPEKHIIPKETLMSQPIQLDSRASLVPLGHFIDHLREAEGALKNCKTHPGDATLVCVSAEQARELEVVLVRTDRKQKDWVSQDMLSEAESERANTKSALARLRPVASKARDGVLSAEELLAAFKAESDPKVARQRFLAMQAERTVIRDEQDVLVLPHAKTLPKKYAAKSSYVLSVLVTGIEKTTADALLILVDKNLSAALFSSTDSGFRGVSTRVLDAEDLRCLNFCMAYDIAISVELAISVNIGGAGIGYSATLIRISNRTETMASVKKAMSAERDTLFS
jgi:hypothetical protein